MRLNLNDMAICFIIYIVLEIIAATIFIVNLPAKMLSKVKDLRNSKLKEEKHA